MPTLASPAQLDAERVFVCVFPTGISYADRQREKHSDYAPLAFLFFDTLELKWEPDCPKHLCPGIEADAAAIQARKGEHYEISAAGQTVLLGRLLLTQN
jgi:hypothetical protein